MSSYGTSPATLPCAATAAMHRRPDGQPGGGWRRREGQSIVEACLAIGLISLLFMGLLQISQLFAAREILEHAAARGARCKTVGFNEWMVRKAVRVASIPNAGKLRTPDFQNSDPFLRALVQTSKPGALWDQALTAQPTSAQYELERARIPDYMYSDSEGRAAAILDYEDWDTIHRTVQSDGNSVKVSVEQDYPLWVPLHRTFYARDSVNMKVESTLENNYSLYIDDMQW